MVGSHHGQAASCEGMSMGAEGQERVARAVVGSGRWGAGLRYNGRALVSRMTGRGAQPARTSRTYTGAAPAQ
eukprot:5930125-Prymnesium_polylepis.1